jgi:peptidoglycan pentaglycine glycine transferase (the first glycine)
MESFPLEHWNEMIAGLPGASILQTAEWARLKEHNGWQALPRAWRGEDGQVVAAAMVLRREVRLGSLPSGLAVSYVPRGPLLDWSRQALREQVLDDLQVLAHANGAIFLKIDADVPLGWGIPERGDAQSSPLGLGLQDSLARRGWLFSAEQVQFRNTAVLNLAGDEASWLARMKSKARYNLRLAERKGVQVRAGGPADYDLLSRMYAETAVRDGFVIRPAAYYHSVWATFQDKGWCIPLIAEVEGQPVAGVVLFVFAGKAWYLYGMSRDLHRDKMPNYLLQWEAMRAAKAHGAQTYDLWGAPDVFDESDDMWGVFRFKEGLGAQVVRTPGAWDYPARPTAYRLYTQLLPRVLGVLRRRGQARTRKEVGA